jgi:hypothetical protein
VLLEGKVAAPSPGTATLFVYAECRYREWPLRRRGLDQCRRDVKTSTQTAATASWNEPTLVWVRICNG